MKKYEKPQMMAKNAPAGSYAAGCPAKDWYQGRPWLCKNCERTG